MQSINKTRTRGQALVIIALSAIVLLGFVAFAIDGSAKFSDRRHAQNAADTAALAGALALVNGDNNWKVDALNRADDNGYDNDLNSNQVWVFRCDEPVNDRSGAPLDCGPYESDDNYVAVIILSHVDTYFARVLGFNQTHNLVHAVAYLREGGPLFDGAAFISVDPSPNCAGGNGSGGGSVDVTGNSTITINGGGFFVNSDETCGFSQTSCSVDLVLTGGGGILSAGSNIFMNENGSNCDANIPTDSTQRQYIIPDDLETPKVPVECSQQAPTPTKLNSNTWMIYPGYYTDFPQNSLVPNNKHIVLAAGVYCVDDDLSWNGSSFMSLDGTSGVTIYLRTGHDISLTINSPIELFASNSGEYENYVIIQEGNMNDIGDCKFTGGQYLIIEGTVFAPYCNITINGDSNTTSIFNAQFVGWDLKINGNNAISVNYDPDYTPQISRKIGLMR